MKGLWKYISPFAPDQSGAAAVLYGLNGIVVICDAGGCAGNICGFDEPRWFSGGKSAVFSAGLRDMDAILGRDDRLVGKLADAARQIDASFAAIVGTPVPAVIGTDYRALKRMAEKQLSIPVVTIGTTGMELYDTGIEKAYDALFRAFAAPGIAAEPETIGVIGAVPLDLMHPGDREDIVRTLHKEGWKNVVLYDSFDDIVQAGRASRNIVISPAGVKSAQYLQEAFGTPYEMRYFGLERVLPDGIDLADANILVVHQQAAANAMRNLLEQRGAGKVTAASWFMKLWAYCRETDVQLKEEDDFCRLADTDAFDIILGDMYFRKALPHFKGTYIDFPHFAVSGRE